MRRERGFTAVELLVAVALTTAILVMIGQSLVTAGRSHGLQRDHMRIAAIGDRVLRSLKRDVGFAAHVFARGTTADEYLAALAIPAAWIAAPSALPAATARGYFDVDPPGSHETGNLLLLVRAREAISVTLEEGEEPRRVDAFQFVAYLVTETAARELDLARWVSAPLASYADLQAIESTWERRRILTKLHEAGVRFAWSAGEPRAQGLFEIRSRGQLVALGAYSTIPADSHASSGGVLGQHALLLATPQSHAAADVPLYARPGDGSVAGAGFEVKIDGPGASRLILVRLVIGARGRPDAFLDSRSIMSSRGL